MRRTRVVLLLAISLFPALEVSGVQGQVLTDFDQTLKVDLDLVLINATVTDDRNQPVATLGAQNFRVFEDRVEQEIRYLTVEELPVSVGVVFDVSSSMADKLSFARDAAVVFLENGSPEDEYFLVEFDDSPLISLEFTGDIARLQNHLIWSRGEGRTALYDAVYLGLEEIRLGANPKKALLLITDGEDNRSRYSHSQIREFVRESDVQIYAIGMLDRSTPRPRPGFVRPGSVGRASIHDMAEVTGGHAFFPNSVHDLEGIVKQINLELKSQYVIGYVSTNTTRDGDWRDVRVTVEPPRGESGLNVRSRRGYYAGIR